MNNIYKDIFNGLLFVGGIFGFISGAFIISTVLFGASAIFSNINNPQRPTQQV